MKEAIYNALLIILLPVLVISLAHAWENERFSANGTANTNIQHVPILVADTGAAGALGIWDTTFSDTFDLEDFTDGWSILNLIVKQTFYDTGHDLNADFTGDTVFLGVYTCMEGGLASYLLKTDTLIPGASALLGDSLCWRANPIDSFYQNLFIRFIYHDSGDFTGQPSDTDYLHYLIDISVN